MTVDLKALKREARSKGTSPARLLDLALLTPVLSRTVANSVHTPTDVLERLAQGSDVPTLRSVARHEHVSERVLEVLATHRHATVRKAVRHRSRLPLRILEAWASSSDADDRLAAAHARALPEALILRLSDDSDPRVMTAIVQHHSETLSQSIFDRYLAWPDRTLHLSVIPHLTSPATLRNAAITDDLEILAAIGRNPNTPVDTLSTLARLVLDGDGHPSLSPLAQSLLKNNNMPAHQRTHIDQLYSTRPLRAVVRTEQSLQPKEPTHDHPRT